jgi:hypothetical protein
MSVRKGSVRCQLSVGKLRTKRGSGVTAAIRLQRLVITLSPTHRV